MKLNDAKENLYEGVGFFHLLRAFITGSAGNVQTINKLKDELDKPMEGHDNMTQGEFFLKQMKDKGIKF